jgi:3-oxoacyl-[acyl-carrier-protein] synthase III
MAKEAVTKALNDAGLQIYDIKQACVGYVYGMYFYNLAVVVSTFSLAL